LEIWRGVEKPVEISTNLSIFTEKTPKFRESNKLIIFLRLSNEPIRTPKTCKYFQKEEMISVKVIFFSINPGVILRKVEIFRKR
jgi:hypothetical protein